MKPSGAAHGDCILDYVCKWVVYWFYYDVLSYLLFCMLNSFLGKKSRPRLNQLTTINRKRIFKILKNEFFTRWQQLFLFLVSNIINIIIVAVLKSY